MNQGGEPAHDDYGLPRVDIQIPDDARELDRDVQAYHRELRALRRHERSLRWRAPLRRSGMIVPLIAGCLVLAMVAGMVLTMFSANQHISGISDQQDGPRVPNSGQAGGNSASASPAAPSASRNSSGGPSATTRAHLPGGQINVDGKGFDLSKVTTAALAIIPAKCRCAHKIQRLVTQAAAAGVTVYLVGERGSKNELKRLAAGAQKAHVAIDADNVLSAYASTHLTLVLVDWQRNVRPARALAPDFHLAGTLKALQPTH